MVEEISTQCKSLPKTNFEVNYENIAFSPLNDCCIRVSVHIA